MMLQELREQVCEANQYMERSGLVKLTWGNVSGIDRTQGLFVIKPSGVIYRDLKPEHMVVIDMDGKVVEGNLKPSSDTPTHVALYRSFKDIGGITHAHSTFATMFAQAAMEIPCLGTTHADQFRGSVPLTRCMTEEEVSTAYEANTGKVVVERFAEINVVDMPAVLVSHHGPLTWGRNASESVKHSIALEEVARIAWGTLMLNPKARSCPPHLLAKHYQRKHGPNAYYGQNNKH